MIWIALMVAMWVMGMVTGWLAGRNPRLLKSRTVSRVKILTPLDNPWGPVSELIHWAEQRAIQEHREAYSDPITESLVASFRAAAKSGQVTILEDHDFRTPNEVRESAGYIRMDSGQYGRFLEGIGYVTASSPELLERACKVVLDQKPGHHATYVMLLGKFHGIAPEVRRASVWVMNDLWFTRIRNMFDPDSHPLWTPPMTIDGPMHLMGIPIDIRDDGGEPHLELNDHGKQLEGT